MHPTTNSDILKSDTSDIIPHIPPDLQQYLTTTERPHEIYRLVDREHNRRVRLLLRRFTNQIQYGCTNPHCNIPTCLSCRKRASAGPLRPHTDLTARALAVKCLEQYATHGKDLARYPSRDKGKKKAVPEPDGLCWNEPVVPWYTDPKEYFVKKNAITRRRSNEQGRYCDSASTTTSTSAQDRSTNGHAKGPGSLDVEGYVGIDRLPICRSKVIKEGGLTSHPPTRVVPGEHDCTNGHVQQPTTKNNSKPGYDQGSFTQSLFKHPKLEELDTSSRVASSISTSTQEEKLSARAHAPDLDLLHIGQSVVTFRILPTKAIEWFEEIFTDAQESKPIPENLPSFLHQCLFFVLSDPTHLLQSASTWMFPGDHNASASLSHTEGSLVLPTSQSILQICDMITQCCEKSNKPSLMVVNVLRALQHSYQLPSHIKVPGNPMSRSRKSEFLSNSEVAHLVLLILSMAQSMEPFSPRAQYTQEANRTARSDTSSSEEASIESDVDERSVDLTKGGVPVTSAMLSLRQSQVDAYLLCETVADLISHRIAIDSATKVSMSRSISTNYSNIVADTISLMQNSLDTDCRRPTQILDTMQMVILAKWDRRPIVRRTGPVGGALELLKGLFIRKRYLALDEISFTMPEIPIALDEVEVPYEWLSFKPDTTKMHILHFSFLFPPKVIVRYFRSLNLKIMKQSHEKAMAVFANGRAQLFPRPNELWSVTNVDEVLDSTRAHMAHYFVMTIRRSHVLEDAIGQIWQRERQELLRPLKVTLGKDEGEQGLDHGGVQQEFFRLVFAEAFDPKYGTFDVDSTTHMAWFRPGSLEQLYKYEALGILMSLAIYNGVTIPINMPLAFYRKILGMKVRKIEHIEDGWPELAKSFSQLLAWDEGDVEDVMALTYDFSYNAFGRTVTIDMSKDLRGKPYKPPSSKGKEKALIKSELKNGNAEQGSSSLEPHHHDESDSPDLNREDTNFTPQSTPTPVTNVNRSAFVKSYITHLTNITINAQFTSFLRGLHTLLSPTALSLFTPSHLKLLFEGRPTTYSLSISSWRSITKYEDFNPNEPVIIWLWDVLGHDLTQVQLRKLLEFVTASDRLPVGGWDGVTFIVQRNGKGDDRLPGSSTCYGRLLLPEYSSKTALKERLIKAIEEGLGFGMI